MKYGMLCPGFGAQYPGMGKELYDAFRIVQEYFEEASDCSGINFVKLCFASSDEDLAEIPHAALALYLWGAASQALLREHTIDATFVGGLDVIGWYTALHGAGAITFPDGLYMLRKWSEMYTTFATTSTCGYLTITIRTPDVIALLANISERLHAQQHHITFVRHVPDAIIVSGEQKSLTSFAEQIRHTSPDIEIEFHTTLEFPYLVLSDDIITHLVQYLEKVDFHTPRIPIAHPFETGWLTEAQEIASLARTFFVHPFRADYVLRIMQQSDTIISTVPGELMIDAYKRWLPRHTVLIIDTLDAFNKVCTTLPKGDQIS